MADAFDLTCQVAAGMLPAYLDDQLEDQLPEADVVRLEQHIVVCPGCRTYLDQMRRTIAAIAGLRQDQPADQAWQETMARLPDPAPAPAGPLGPVRAYKFLSAGRLSPFARVRWPLPGSGWVAGPGPVGPCRLAVHACRPEDLAYWLDERLWQVELAGQVTESPFKIAAARGRLVAEVPGWPEAGAAFIQDCQNKMTQLLARAGQEGNYRAEGFLNTYVSEIEADHDPASVGYTTAHAADVVGWTKEEAMAARVGHENSPFDTERRRQSRWLAQRLGLDEVSAP